MSFIPQITCRNCGEKFSAIHSRCPHCGARHVKQSGRAAPTTAAAQASAPQGPVAANARFQLIFGAILIVAVIVAVIILITASLSPSAAAPPPATDTPDLPSVTTDPPETPPPPPTDTPTPTIAATSITITYAGSQCLSFTQRTTWDPTPLRADVYPREALDYADVIWRSSDESVCTVDENGTVTAVGLGECTIIAECGGIAASCKVNVPS